MKKRLVLFALLLAGCTKAQMLDLAMKSAKRPDPPRGMRVGDRQVLAGDMHCHVLPPDAPWHVTRELPETLALADEEELDFVVLTPHVPRRFFADEGMREWVLKTQDEVAERVSERRPRAIVIPGFEYTDHQSGHVGAAFADVRAVLREVPVEEAERHPARFFERWVAHGGVLTINHPVERPLPRSPFYELRADLSWRAFSGREVPEEIAWITAHAQTVETFNASIAHLRDQFVLGDEDRSIREAAALLDRQRRRVAPVGGSDSHGSWLRATTYVLAAERSAAGVREALASGRTCVRGPEACTLEVSPEGGGWKGVGESLARGGRLRARSRGAEATYLVDGAVAASGLDGETVTIAVPEERCSIVRAVVGRSFSAPIYIACAWARTSP